VALPKGIIPIRAFLPPWKKGRVREEAISLWEKKFEKGVKARKAFSLPGSRTCKSKPKPLGCASFRKEPTELQ